MISVFTIRGIIKVATVDVGNKGRFNGFLLDLYPVDIVKPRVTDHVVYGLEALGRVFLEHLAQERSCLWGQTHHVQPRLGVEDFVEHFLGVFVVEGR